MAGSPFNSSSEVESGRRTTMTTVIDPIARRSLRPRRDRGGHPGPGIPTLPEQSLYTNNRTDNCEARSDDAIHRRLDRHATMWGLAMTAGGRYFGHTGHRTEERRVGKERVSKGRSRWDREQ